MNITSILTLIILIGNSLFVLGQTGVIKGHVYNSINNEPVPFANIIIDSTLLGATSDIDGNFRIDNIQPGVYNLTCRFIGFKPAKIYEVMVSSAKPVTLNFSLTEEASTLDEIEIKASPFNKTEESPVSVRTISATEIYRNPGGNRDISKVIQSLPGVAGSVAFRNDLIVRGGAPSENRFFLDGIEIPNINHFATQGSSGGPVGLLNVNFIRDVDFYAGAFPANRGNALSSVLEFKQIEGNDEKISGTFMFGSSDVGLTLDGPIGKKSTFILSARRSYLQFLFKALSLPFLPTYNDFQYKQVFNINDKNKLVLLGLGAIDDFSLNTSVNEGINDSSLIRRNNYILGNLPVNTQWNYAIGANWIHFSKESYQNLVVSRNSLNNSSEKYQDNTNNPADLILDYNSKETENKIRLEHTIRKNGWKWNAGIGLQNVFYTNSSFIKKELFGKVISINHESELSLNKFAGFTQLSKSFFNKQLVLSAGIRTDFSDYNSSMSNPLKQISPRFSTSYSITKKLSLNFNTGRYFQLPAYTVLGYRDSLSNLVNKKNNITYIQADHIIAGIEINQTDYLKISVEGFYKTYKNYPFLLNDSIPLANLGSDFGVIGNEPVSSTSNGRSYGIELFVQQKLSSSIYGIVSYTYVRSEFQNKNDVFVPSAWDNRHILNITAGKKFKKNWEAGIKFRLLGGAPYTPYDVQLSSLKSVWDVTRQGVYDWDQLNQKRNKTSHGLDIRIDKKWFFKNWALNTYIDVQNLYKFETIGQPFIDVERDASGNLVEDPSNPLAYKTTSIENSSGTLLPSIGIMIEF